MNITLPSLLDTLIGLVAVYLALAVLCSHINEQLAAASKLRGIKLYQGVLNLLSGEKHLVNEVFAHPLITASSDDRNGVPNAKTATNTAGRGYRPSFIDSRNFSLAMWDAIQRSNPPVAGQPITINATAMSQVASPYQLFGQIKTAVGKLPQGNLRGQLVALLNDSQGDYDRLLRATDAFFDRQMDRVTGWYKRHTQAIVFAIGFAVVFLAGVDSIRICSRLYGDTATRTAIAEAAAKAALASKSTTSTQANAEGTQSRDAEAKAAAQLNTIFAKLPVDTYLTGLTGGWSDPTDADDLARLHTVFLHLIGLLITVIAVSLGAPFWFDALSSLTNMRLAGQKPPDKADPKNNPPPPAP